MDRERLDQTLGRPELRRLVERIRRRLELGRGLRGAVTLREPEEHERGALARLLGRDAPRGATVSVGLDELDDALRHAGICDGLEQAIAALTGTWIDHRQARLRSERDWAALFDSTACLARAGHGSLEWLGTLAATGLLRRLALGKLDRARELLDQVLELAGRLPTRGQPLAELAATVSGDSHALDAGQPLGTLALDLVRAVFGARAGRDASSRRDAWAAAGVLCDELSAPVLVLNVRACVGTSAAAALNLHADAGEPYHVTTRQLLREPPAFERSVTGAGVYLCENPSVLAAAANTLGLRSAPLVCLGGQPKTAGGLLLRLLSSAGIALAYHGDFDWAGVRIANLVMRRHGAKPWRLGAGDYPSEARGPRLRGRPADADWDPRLRPEMERAGRAVHEEELLAVLLEDLGNR